MKKAKKTNAELMAKSMQLLNFGYQRILTFQTPAGGFSWWGSSDTPRIWVTAYGLQQITDVSKVYEIDPKVIERAQNWLISQQNKEGAWTVVGDTHGEAVAIFKEPAIPLTAYIAWSLGESGYNGEPLQKAISFIKNRMKTETNAYCLGLIANALTVSDHNAREVFDKLEQMKKTDGDCVYWDMDGQSLSYARGDAGSVEATAQIAYAMLKSGQNLPTAQKAINYIIKKRSAYGSWGSTQATILALKTLIASLGAKKQEGDVTLTVKLNDTERKLKITPDQADVMQIIDFKNETRTGKNTIEISSEGKGAYMYQVVSRAYVPWNKVEKEDRVQDIEFDVKYDRTELSKSDTLGVNVDLKYNGKNETYMVIVDLGIPAGFDVVRDSFQKMVDQKLIEKFSVTGKQIILYFGVFKPAQEVAFSYQLKPKYPIKVKTPESSSYEYYTPDNRTKTKPVEIEVKD